MRPASFKIVMLVDPPGPQVFYFISLSVSSCFARAVRQNTQKHPRLFGQNTILIFLIYYVNITIEKERKCFE